MKADDLAEAKEAAALELAAARLEAEAARAEADAVKRELAEMVARDARQRAAEAFWEARVVGRLYVSWGPLPAWKHTSSQVRASCDAGSAVGTVARWHAGRSDSSALGPTASVPTT